MRGEGARRKEERGAWRNGVQGERGARRKGARTDGNAAGQVGAGWLSAGRWAGPERGR